MKAEIKGVLSRILKLSMVCFQFENFKLKHCVKKVRKKISESALARIGHGRRDIWAKGTSCAIDSEQQLQRSSGLCWTFSGIFRFTARCSSIQRAGDEFTGEKNESGIIHLNSLQPIVKRSESWKLI